MKAVISYNRRYYKTQVQEYVQPQLFANTGDRQEIKLKWTQTAGSNSVNVFQAFYPNTGSFNAYRDEAKYIGYLGIYLKYPTKLTSLSLHVVSGSGSVGSLYSGNVYLASTWGGTDTLLASVSKISEGADYTFNFNGNTEFSNYYTLSWKNGGSAGNDRVKVSNIRLYGEWEYPKAPGTKDDYDLYIDEPIYKVPLITNKYYGIKR